MTMRMEAAGLHFDAPLLPKNGAAVCRTNFSSFRPNREACRLALPQRHHVAQAIRMLFIRSLRLCFPLAPSRPPCSSRRHCFLVHCFFDGTDGKSCKRRVTPPIKRQRERLFLFEANEASGQGENRLPVTTANHGGAPWLGSNGGPARGFWLYKT